MATFSNTWDETKPAGDDAASQLDTFITDGLKKALAERYILEHRGLESGQKTTTHDAAEGRHIPGQVSCLDSAAIAALNSSATTGAIGYATDTKQLCRYQSEWEPLDLDGNVGPTYYAFEHSQVGEELDLSLSSWTTPGTPDSSHSVVATRTSLLIVVWQGIVHSTDALDSSFLTQITVDGVAKAEGKNEKNQGEEETPTQRIQTTDRVVDTTFTLIHMQAVTAATYAVLGQLKGLSTVAGQGNIDFTSGDFYTVLL